MIRFFKYFIFIFIVVIPLIHLTSVVDSTMLPRQIWFSLFVFIAVIFFISLKIKIKNILVVHLLLFSLSMLSGFSIIYAFNLAEAIYTFNKMLLSAAVFSVFFLIFQNNIITTLEISKAVLIFLIIACGFQIYELFEKANLHLLEGKNLYEINSLFGHKNLFSSVVFLTIPFIVYLILNGKTIIKISAIVVLLVLIILLFFIQTKAVLIALFLGGGISVIVLLKSLFKRKNIVIFTLLAIIFSGGILFFLLKNKLTLLSNNDTVVERILLWSNTWKMIQEHPFIGVGAGNWQIFFPKYGLQNFVQTNYLVSDGLTTFQRPHNDFLWIWSEQGIVSLLLYISIFVVVIYYSIRNIKNQINLKGKIIHAAFLMAIIGYVFIAFVDFPLERSEHQFFILLIISWVTNEYFISNNNIYVFKFKNINAILIAIFIFNIVTFTNRLNAESHSKKVIVSHQKGNWNLMIKEAKKCTNLFYTIDNFSIPLQWYTGVAYSSLGEYNLAKIEFEKAYQINPYQLHVLNNIASINEMEGKHDLAVKYYNEALVISPFQPDALLNKSAVLFNKGLVNEAFLNILNFNFDETNEQFKKYYLTITKAKFEADFNNKTIDATKLPFKLSDLKNDSILINSYNQIKTIYLNSNNN